MFEATGSPAEVDFEGALAELAPRIDPEAQSIANLCRLSGGATQEIWQFELTGDGKPRPLILRRAPGGNRRGLVGVGLEGEASLMTAAAAEGVPVPPVRYVLDGRDALGCGFVMDFVPGETLGRRIVNDDNLAGARPLFAQQCGAILARIHRIDADRFPTLDRVSPAELIEQWRTAYRKANWSRPVFELAFNWLVERCPKAPTAACVVHGDFRNGNLIVGPEGIRAVLDWELAHVGDRHEDFGWLCVSSWRFGRIDKPVGGIGESNELFDGYEAAGGEKIDRDAAHWWEVLGTLRWGVMCAGAAMAFRSDDPTPERAMIARRTSETEIDLLRMIAD